MPDSDHRSSRRTFIKTTGAALSGLAIAGCGTTNTPARTGAPAILRSGPAPSDTIVMGMIGVGGMGMNRLEGFLEHSDVQVAAICDLDTRHLDEAVQTVRDARGGAPDRYHDFRELLARQDIDAVTVVTPDHWHAIPMVRACEAGKDVFVEKPLSYSVAEGRAMVEAAREHGRVTQMGNHIHNDVSNYRRVVERVRSGQLGRVTRVDLWKTSDTDGRGNPPNEAPPPELDYDFWQGPAPRRPYNPLRSHFTFRYFWDYSGGVFIDFWCHIADVAFWALDLHGPTLVTANGGRFYLEDGTETPDTELATFEFPGVVMTYNLHPKPLPGYEHMGHIGAVFTGEDATLVTNYSRHEVYVDGELVPDMPEPAMHIPDSPGHLREFLDGVKSRNMDTTCRVEYGHRLSKVGLLGNIAYRTKSAVRWNDANETVIDNPAASRLLRRDMRAPWSL